MEVWIASRLRGCDAGYLGGKYPDGRRHYSDNSSQDIAIQP
jgi:hypothetical protein